MFAQHELPDKIILNKNLRFITAFWEIFLAEQRVWVATSTVYYLQTDSQTKRLNQILKQYLQHYINYTQNNWSGLLPVA